MSPATMIFSGYSLHSIFEQQARRHPTHIAVSCAGNHINYADLDAWANIVADELLQAGLSGETIVPLYAERGIEAVVGAIAILKAGGAYLPIDPTLPTARVEWLLEDCGATLAVVTPRLADRLPASLTRVVQIGDPVTGGSGRPLLQADLKTDRALAYVIYTSGSTGASKGVLVEHRNVLALLRQTAGLFGFGPQDVWTMFHSMAFDFSVWEMWGALLFGGRLVIPSFSVTRSPDRFCEMLRAERVTVLNQTPAAFRLLIPEFLAGTPEDSALRLVIFGGERLDVAMLAPWMTHHGAAGPRLVNMFGITETTVHASVREISPQDLESPAISPIGAPLPGYEFFVLDANGAAVSDGTPGELYIAGTGVARGYLNRPDLTEQRFVTKPALTAARLYRTGDCVIRVAEREYVSAGRLDDQIKLRGFRIEPREIEVCVASHPAVGACVVIAHDYGEGDVRLLAYVTPKDQPFVEEQLRDALYAQLSQHCADSLPIHMRPSLFCALPELPLTVNGKVDKAALPRPTLAEVRAANPYATPTEAKVAEIWCRILGHSAVSSQEDFFDLGGTSLALVRMFRGINSAFNTRLEMEGLIASGKLTVVALATRLDGLLTTRAPA